MIDFSEFKKFFLFNLIGALIISAIVAVITVLVGDFGDITGKVLFTLFMVMTHSLISLAFIWDNSRRGTFDRLNFFSNALFLLIVLSFITSMLGIWEVISGELVGNLYQTYFIAGFASLHSNILSKSLSKEKYLDIVVYINYVFIGIVVLMLMPIIYIHNAFDTLGEFYYRSLGAAGIIDGTLSLLSILFYKLYMHKHPEEQNTLSEELQAGKIQRKGLSVWVWILIIYLLLQITVPLVFFFLIGL